ncbi:MAG: hypothetical protein ACLP7P_05875 [Rhodomicrobium sp.]
MQSPQRAAGTLKRRFTVKGKLDIYLTDFLDARFAGDKRKSARLSRREDKEFSPVYHRGINHALAILQILVRRCRHARIDVTPAPSWRGAPKQSGRVISTMPRWIATPAPRLCHGVAFDFAHDALTVATLRAQRLFWLVCEPVSAAVA